MASRFPDTGLIGKVELFEIRSNHGRVSARLEGKKQGITDDRLVNVLIPQWCGLLEEIARVTKIESSKIVSTVTLLDLSHNSISDYGLCAIFYHFLLKYGLKVESLKLFWNNISNLTPVCEYVFRLGHPHSRLWPATLAGRRAESGLEESADVTLKQEQAGLLKSDGVDYDAFDDDEWSFLFELEQKPTAKLRLELEFQKRHPEKSPPKIWDHDRGAREPDLPGLTTKLLSSIFAEDCTARPSRASAGTIRRVSSTAGPSSSTTWATTRDTTSSSSGGRGAVRAENLRPLLPPPDSAPFGVSELHLSDNLLAPSTVADLLFAIGLCSVYTTGPKLYVVLFKNYLGEAWRVPGGTPVRVHQNREQWKAESWENAWKRRVGQFCLTTGEAGGMVLGEAAQRGLAWSSWGPAHLEGDDDPKKGRPTRGDKRAEALRTFVEATLSDAKARHHAPPQDHLVEAVVAGFLRFGIEREELALLNDNYTPLAEVFPKTSPLEVRIAAGRVVRTAIDLTPPEDMIKVCL